MTKKVEFKKEDCTVTINLPCPLNTPVWFIGETKINGGDNVVYYTKQIPFTLNELGLFNKRVFLTRIAMENKLKSLKKNNPCYITRYDENF